MPTMSKEEKRNAYCTNTAGVTAAAVMCNYTLHSPYPQNRNLQAYLHSVLADSQSVPQLDGLVTRGRDNLTIVSGERNTHHILLMTHKLTGRSAAKINKSFVHYRTLI